METTISDAERQVENAIAKYLKGEVSSWRAAQLAGISLRRMLSIFTEWGIEIRYSVESLAEDMK